MQRKLDNLNQNYNHYNNEVLIESKALINKGATALAVTSDGNILSSFARKDGSGSIVLRDPLGNPIRTLVNRGATALAITPEGNILSSFARKDGSGSIALRDPLGNPIRTLVKRGATALAVTPDGNILSSFARKDGSGSIVLRDPLGNPIRTLVNKGATALAVTPDGNILSSFVRKDGSGKIKIHKWTHDKVLYRNSQQLFINEAIALANAFFSPKKDMHKPHLSMLPTEVILMMILELGKNTLGMSQSDKIQCGKLILKNFSIRRDLIQRGEYKPGEKIEKWWSQSTRDQEKKKIFCRNSDIKLFKQYKKNQIESQEQLDRVNEYSIM